MNSSIEDIFTWLIKQVMTIAGSVAAKRNMSRTGIDVQKQVSLTKQVRVGHNLYVQIFKKNRLIVCTSLYHGN